MQGFHAGNVTALPLNPLQQRRQQAAEQVLFCTVTALGLVRLVCQPKLMGASARNLAEASALLDGLCQCDARVRQCLVRERSTPGRSIGISSQRTSRHRCGNDQGDGERTSSGDVHDLGSYLRGSAQLKLAASSVLPLPLYVATCG